MQVRQQWRWLVAAASIVVPLAAVLGSLSYQDGVWVLVTFAAAAAAASVALVELSERHHHHPKRAESHRPDLPGTERAVSVLDVYGKRVDSLHAD